MVKGALHDSARLHTLLFPAFDVGVLPASAADGQLNGLGKRGITFDPAPDRGTMNAIPRGKLGVGQVGFRGHCRLHSYAMATSLNPELNAWRG